MTLSPLPLCYCTNVHPAESLATLQERLQRFVPTILQQRDQSLSVGLWLPNSALEQVSADSTELKKLRVAMQELDISCYTMNAFPFGDFHFERVKDNVYRPDWSTSDRLDYTKKVALFLAELLPADGSIDGSISTLPLGYKNHFDRVDDFQPFVSNLVELALFLDRMRKDTGKTIRLAIEPEPRCLLETTPEAISFFQSLRQYAASQGCLDEVVEFIGLCFDVCHQAVEFEDVARSITAYHAEGIRLNKIQISSAVEINDPGNRSQRETLKHFVEPRYMHQTFRRLPDGKLVCDDDLSEAFVENPPGEWKDAECWRVHFHVPIHQQTMEGLGTTRAEIGKTLGAVASLPYAPHLEIETYTWSVMPAKAGQRGLDLGTNLAYELASTDEILRAVSSSFAGG